MEHKRKLVHTSLIPIRWGDMDVYGHVNNTIYFRYAEQARVEWFELFGYRVQPSGGSPVIINASCTFLVSFVYPGNVELKLYASHPGRSSFITHYEMRLEGSDTLYAEGTAKIVWMDASTGKSVPLPAELRALIES